MDAKIRERAWEIYTTGDTILHSRIQTTVIAQSFLVTGQAALYTIDNPSIHSEWFGVGICILAMIITWVMLIKSNMIYRKIRHIRNRYLMVEDDMFFEYMTCYENDDAKRRTLSRAKMEAASPLNMNTIDAQTAGLGWSFLAFWVAVALLWFNQMTG